MARQKRHGHREGSIYLRKDGRWVAEITLEDGNRKQFYRKTRKEAFEALQKALHEQKQGILATGPQQTMKQYLDDWLENVHKPTLRDNSYILYRMLISKHILPAIGHIQLQKLSPQQVQALYARKLQEGYAASTVRAIHRLLHKALSDAVRWNLVSINVCDRVKQPRSAKHNIQPLTKEQAQTLLEAAKGHSLEGLLTLALATGMRRGEILSLRWQDIDFLEKCLYIHHTVNRIGKKGLVESEPKTATSKRKVILPQFVIEALHQQYTLREEIRAKAGAEWRELDLVFSNSLGGYIEPSNLRVMFKRVLKSAGLPDMRFHDLRHSAATLLLSMGAHPKLVQELLGHSNISITMDTYSHVLPSMHREMMDGLDDFFKKT
jgi:integrase